MMCIVLAAILPFRLKSGTYLKSQFWRYGHVPEIEQLVQVRAQQKSVIHAVRTMQCIRFDMGGLKHWESLLSRYGAASLVGIGHEHAERALAEPAPRQILGTEPILSYEPSDKEGSPTLWLSASAALTELHRARPSAIAVS